MRLMDVVTTYLYGSLYANVYMKIPKEFTLPEAMIQNHGACIQSSCKDLYMD